MVLRRGCSTCFRAISRRNRHIFITTPIFYANADPHVGHLHSAVLADAAHRWACLNDPEGTHIFSTGTDEHGSKIARTAAAAGRDCQGFCDDVSERFRRLFGAFDVNYTHYIRTTDVAHKQAVQEVWKRLRDADLIYKDKYRGWYSIVDECFYPDGDVEKSTDASGNTVMVVKGTRTVVDWVEEENYMFRLSAFRERTRKLLTERDIVQPSHYLPLALSALDAEGDLSVSRDASRLRWGIQVPGNPEQTIYVWLDALVNYLTVNGYPEKMLLPAPTCQLIGKDIVKFHTVYWLAFLQALGLDPPERIFVHGHWLVDGTKMSKSIGNVVDPMHVRDVLSSEGMRYFLLRQGVPTDDCNFTMKKAIDLVNSDLVNTIGNLLSRSSIDKLNPDQVYHKFEKEALNRDLRTLASEITDELNSLKEVVSPHYESLYFYRGIDEILSVVRKTNLFMQNAAPWKMQQGDEISSVLSLCYETVRVATILLSPIVPNFSQHALDRLGISAEMRSLSAASFIGDSKSATGTRLGDDKGPFLNRIVGPQTLHPLRRQQPS